MMRFAVAAFAAFALLSSAARAQMMGVGPGGHGNYLNVHGEFASRMGPSGFQVPSGLSIDWGGFTSRYVGGGSRIGISRMQTAPGVSPWVLFFGGGGQFHIPLGEQASLIPSFNLGYRLGAQGVGGLAVTGALAGVANVDRFYFGLEAETFLFAQGVGSEVFPGTLSISGLFGLYY